MRVPHQGFAGDATPTKHALAPIVLGVLVAIDDDTIRMDGRLLGFDPLRDLPGHVHSEYEKGHAARKRLGEIIALGAVLEHTGKSCKYGRECAYLRLKGEDVTEI